MISMLYVGRVVERQKRFSILCNLSHALHESGCDHIINVYGEIFDRYQVGSEFIFHGYVERWWDDLKGSEVFVNVSDYEGCPLALLEFVRRGGRQVLVRDMPWTRLLIPRHSRFLEIGDAVEKLRAGSDLSVESDRFSAYWDLSRFQADTKDLERWLF